MKRIKWFFIKYQNYILGLAVFVIAVSVYLKTAAPGLYIENDFYLGKHGWLLAIFAAIVATLVYFILSRLKINKWSAFSGALILAFSNWLWPRAIRPDILNSILWLVILVFFIVLLERMKKYAQTKMTHQFAMIIFSVVFYLCLLALPLAFLWRNFEQNNLSDYHFADEYAQAMIDSVEPNAIVLLNDDSLASKAQTYLLTYKLTKEKVRPDVLLVNKNDKALKEYLDMALKNNRSLYTNFVIDKLNDRGALSKSYGILYKAVIGKDDFKKVSLINNLELSSVNHYRVLNDITHKDILAHYYYSQSAYYHEKSLNELFEMDKTFDLEKSQDSLLNAIKFDPTPFSDSYNKFVAHRELFDE